MIDRRCDIGGFRARGHWRVDHRLQHLRGDDHRLARAPTLAYRASLDARHFLGRQFDAQVAARDHHGVRLVDDGVECLHRRRFFQLGHDAGAAAGQRARFVQVFRALHERERQPLDPELQRELEIAPILLCQR